MGEQSALIRLVQELEDGPEGVLRAAEQWLTVRGRDGLHRPLLANTAQRKFEQRRGRENIVLKARQMGITTWVSARFFLRTIAYPGTLTLQVAHTRAAAQAIFRGVQRMWEGLPEDLRRGELKRSRANVNQMVFPRIDSEFRVASANDIGAGRGMSLQNLHCSEVSRWPGNAVETLAGLRAALAPRGELILESTPNGAYGPFYEEWCHGVDDPEAAGLVRHFLPWWLESAYTGPAVEPESMTLEECDLVDRLGLSSEQIGFRRNLERSYAGLRAQEFVEDAETCFRTSGDCCFEISVLEQRLIQAGEPYQTRRNGTLQIWQPALPGKRYVMGVDTAGGGSEGDFAAVQVIEVETGLQCAELQQRLRPLELARVVAALAKEYGDAIIAVERNNHGAAVLAYLMEGDQDVQLYTQHNELGWLTTVASRPEMIGRLAALLAEQPEIFASRRFLGECRTFVSNERGRPAAASGAHDDLVMAMSIAQAVRAEELARGCRSR